MKQSIKNSERPKNVSVDRLNREYVCGECGGFLVIFGPKKNKEWRCVDCNMFYLEEQLVTKAFNIVVVDVNGSRVIFNYNEGDEPIGK